jgi:hypothetical protein
MAYTSAEARQELLEALVAPIDEIATALAALGAAYELLDDRTADQLEEQLFGPVQGAYGRAQRTHAGFAERSGLATHRFLPATVPAASHGVKGLIDAAVSAAHAADMHLAELQDTMAPVEVGDAELRAGLADVREHLGSVGSRARTLVSRFGR